jgi:hypothetical protein
MMIACGGWLFVVFFHKFSYWFFIDHRVVMNGYFIKYLIRFLILPATREGSGVLFSRFLYSVCLVTPVTDEDEIHGGGLQCEHRRPTKNHS